MSNKSNYKLGKISEYITGEIKAMTELFNDPAQLNFKFFIDFKADSGLFADEKHTNSALNYLKRIGENARYELLKKFISRFKEIIENYEYLFLDIEGLDIIQNAKPYQLFGSDEDKIVLKLYESLDFKIQQLITSYRKIFFDDNRNVEVLPINLQRFNCHIYVFNSGYYNDLLYGTDSNVEDIRRKMFPTKDKIINNKFTELNHQLFVLEDVIFDVTESGKDFITNISNQMKSDFIINNLVFKFKFAKYTARFNHVFGDFDFDSLLILDSIQNNYENSVGELDKKINVGKLVKEEVLRFDAVKRYVKSRKQILDKSIAYVKTDEFKKQAIKSLTKTGKTYLETRLDFIRNGQRYLNQVDNIFTSMDFGLNIKQFEQSAISNIYNRTVDIQSFDGEDKTNPFYRENNEFYDKNIELRDYNVYTGNL